MPIRDMIGKTTGGVMRLIRNHRAPIRALGLLILGLSSFSSVARAQTMTAAERQQLVDKLDASQKKLFSALQGVSEVQWHWKPAPDKWSIAEVADHIDLAEIKTPQLVHDMATHAPATPEKKAEVSGKDQRVAS